jgi:Ubiquitin family
VVPNAFEKILEIMLWHLNASLLVFVFFISQLAVGTSATKLCTKAAVLQCPIPRLPSNHHVTQIGYGYYYNLFCHDIYSFHQFDDVNRISSTDAIEGKTNVDYEERTEVLITGHSGNYFNANSESLNYLAKFRVIIPVILQPRFRRRYALEEQYFSLSLEGRLYPKRRKRGGNHTFCFNGHKLIVNQDSILADVALYMKNISDCHQDIHFYVDGMITCADRFVSNVLGAYTEISLNGIRYNIDHDVLHSVDLLPTLVRPMTAFEYASKIVNDMTKRFCAHYPEKNIYFVRVDEESLAFPSHAKVNDVMNALQDAFGIQESPESYFDVLQSTVGIQMFIDGDPAWGDEFLSDMHWNALEIRIGDRGFIAHERHFLPNQIVNFKPMTTPIEIKSVLGGTTITLLHVNDITVAELKERIFHDSKIPSEVQSLIFKGQRLDDKLHLSSYDINAYDVIYLIRKLSGGGELSSQSDCCCDFKCTQSAPIVIDRKREEIDKMTTPIELKTLSGGWSIAVYDINNINVKDLKRRIFHELRVPTKAQSLVYQAQTLEDDRTLSSYGIRAYDTVYLTRRLRGGGKQRSTCSACSCSHHIEFIGCCAVCRKLCTCNDCQRPAPDELQKQTDLVTEYYRNVDPAELDDATKEDAVFR